MEAATDDGGHDSAERQRELRFITTVVRPRLNGLRERKTDLELREDARFFNKYGDFLRQRFENKTHYQRLGLQSDATGAQIRRAYHVRASCRGCW
jgi:hypothetical protein